MLLLVDLDGVVYRGAAPIPGVAAVLADRAAHGDTVVYVTNNSMHYRADYVTRLAGLGAPVSADRVVSSARATALYLADPAWTRPVRRVLAVGAGGLERECRDAGLDVVTAAHAATRQAQEGLDGWEAAGHPDAVVVGLDPQFTYQKLAVAVDCVHHGARFVATNRDPVFPTERGSRPGAGSIVAAVEAGAQVSPVSIGKPGPLLLEMAIRVAGLTRDDAVMIGDGLATDLAAANGLGIPCVLMLTGVTSRAQAEALPAAERPAAVAARRGRAGAGAGAARGATPRPGRAPWRVRTPCEIAAQWRHHIRPACSGTTDPPEGCRAMSTVLVTGASGFVGSHVIPELLGGGHRVVALVRSPAAGETVLAAALRGPRRRRGAAHRRRDRPGDPAGRARRASTPSSTSSRSRATGTAGRTSSGSTSGARRTSSPRWALPA